MGVGKPTGRFVVRVSPELHGRLRQEAARRGVSLNSLCASALSAGVREPDAPAPQDSTWSTWVEKARGCFGEALLGVLLFGSVARGEQSDDSDVDLLIVLHDDTPITRDLYRRWDETEPADDAVNPHLVHLPSSAGVPGLLWLEVAMDGVVLYDPSRLLARALSTLRRRLASGEISCRTAHGQRYWIHDDPEGRHAQ